MAKSRDEDGREVEIDERYFMEWFDLGMNQLRDRLAAEAEMDKFDRNRQEGASDGSE